jgi:hypothetical protein
MLRLRLIFPVIVVAATLFVALPAGPAFAAFYNVDTTSDASLTACTGAAADCSLRGAITNANASPVADTINFNSAVFPSGTPATILLGSTLPPLTGGTDTLDATGNGVIVQGTEARNFDCLSMQSAGNTVKGFQFTDCNIAITFSSSVAHNNVFGPGNTFFDNNTGIGVIFAQVTGTSIIGNKFGTNPAGTAIPPEGGNDIGVLSAGSTTTVGGTTASARNVISGNNTGISIGSGTGSVIRGNFIGTDINGTVDLGNLGTGVAISGPASSNVIGGTGPGEGNLISGNSTNLRLQFGATGNSVIGNVIGPDFNGSGAAMTGDGIIISGASNGNTIGPGNLISDGGSGVSIQSSDGNVVKGNLIGTNFSGTSGVPNTFGITIQSGARFNTIGGVAPGDGNVIAFNNSTGVVVTGSGTNRNSIRANSIHSNTGLEIDNNTGGNTEIAPPALNSLSPTANSVSGTACPNCAVDIFSTGSGGADSRIYEGSVTANSGGGFTFTSATPLAGTNLVATHTDGFGNTSELSAAVFAENCDGLDNDNDGLKDEGHPDSDGDGRKDCVDAGFTAFYPPGHSHSAPVADCTGVAEDFDGFKDTDGCPEPDNDNDGYPDSGDTCPGNDNLMGPDGALGVGGDQNHNGLVDGGETWAPLGTSGNDDSVRTYEDYDGILDTDGCHDSPCDDVDGDSFGAVIGACKLFADEREAQLGTNSLRACAATSDANDEAMDPYPLDTNDDGFTDITDIVSITGRFGEAQTPSNVRYELNLDGFIDISDIVLMTGRFGQACVPPGPFG